jgi:Na+/H+-dicarboxylate symporter
VARFDEVYETPKWRTFWLLAAFALLVGIGVVTVLQPELEDEPDQAEEMPDEPSAEASHTEPLQE